MLAALGLKEAWDWFWDQIPEWATPDGIAKLLEGLYNDFKQWAVNLLNSIVSGLGDMLGDLMGWAEGLLSQLGITTKGIARMIALVVMVYMLIRVYRPVTG